MTAKLIAFYKSPGDAEAVETFEQLYFETHVPLAAKMPGLRKMEVYRLDKNLMGGAPPYHLVAELTFDDQGALEAALASPEGKAAGKNLMGFASHYTTLTAAEDVTPQGALCP